MRDKIIDEIDELTKKYEMLFARDEDLKSLQGMERCIEMKMKACGMDGKNKIENDDNSNNETRLILSELPTKFINELIEIANSKNKMNQQQ